MTYRKRFGLIIEGIFSPVPLKESKIHATVHGFIANVECQLTYTNDTYEPLQTSFVFPLDDMSAVYKFEADINGRHIVAECQEKEQARRTYDEAISQGHTAMLLAEDDNAGDIFECKLGNLPARETAILTMSYVVELSATPRGEMRFILPTVLNPRYFPADSVIEKNRGWSTGEEITMNSPYVLTFTASISGRHAIKSVSSSKEKLRVKYNEYMTSAFIELPDVLKFDHDLSFDIVYYNVNKPEVVIEWGEPLQDGLLKEDLLMLNYLPSFQIHTENINNRREFIFVLDRSGSMYGNRIKKSKETLLLLLKSLQLGCLFNVVSFGSSHTFLFTRSEEYTEKTLKKAVSLQSSMDADMGGTEILKPLTAIYREKAKEAYPRQIFLLTDGEVGNTNEVISLVRQNAANTRVFTFGIGDGVSTTLIKGIAKVSNAKATFIRDKDNMQAKVMSIMKSSMADSFSDVQIEWRLPSNVSLTRIPTQPPTIFRGEKLVVFALLKWHDERTTHLGSVHLKGYLNGKPVTHSTEIEAVSTVHQDLPLHRVAAKYQIKELELSDYGQSNECLIVLVSKSANVVSKYTAFVGVDRETRVRRAIISPPGVGSEKSKTRTYIPPLLDNIRSGMLAGPIPPPPPAGGAPPYIASPPPPPPPPPSHYQSSRIPPPRRMNKKDKEQPPPVGPPATVRYSSTSPPPPPPPPLPGTPPPPPGTVWYSSTPPPPPPPGRVWCSSTPPPPPRIRNILHLQDFDGLRLQSCDRLPPPCPPSHADALQSALMMRTSNYDEADGSDSDNNDDDWGDSCEAECDNMMGIISLQNFNGSWSSSKELANATNFQVTLLRHKYYPDNIWCTAVIIEILRRKYADRHEEWELIERKAVQWLTSQLEDEKGLHDLFKEIHKLFNK